MGRGLVGEHVGHEPAPYQLGQHLRDVADQPHGERALLRAGLLYEAERAVEIGLHPIAVARLQPSADARLVHIHAEKCGAVHGRGQRLGATHAAEASGHDETSFEGAAEVLAGTLRKGLVGPLEDSLGADVDPRARGHLAVHGEAQRVEPAELVPRRPARHQVGVRDEHPGRLVMGPEHTDGLSALDQQGFVVLQTAQRGDDPLVALPVSRCLPAAAVDHELLRALRDRGIEIVHEHPESRLLMPAFAGERRPRRGGDRRWVGQCGHREPGIWRWENLTGGGRE